MRSSPTAGMVLNIQRFPEEPGRPEELVIGLPGLYGSGYFIPLPKPEAERLLRKLREVLAQMEGPAPEPEIAAKLEARDA